MGSNKTFQQKGDRGRVLGESDEFRKLHRAIEKAHGDRDQAIRNVCRLHGVKTSMRCPARSGQQHWRCLVRTSEGFLRGTDEATARLGYEEA